ncbi:beta family protein [Planctomycetota bacterium]
MIKDWFRPLIEIPEFGFDFEKARKPRTIDDHLIDFANKKVLKKWGDSFCFIDFNLIEPEKRMSNGDHPIPFIFDELRKLGCQAIPVTGLQRDEAHQNEIQKVIAQDNSGACFRITLEQAAISELKSKVDSLLSMLKIKPDNCDFILDLVSPNFDPLEGFAKVIRNIVSKLPHLNIWRTFTVLGTSFPETMADIRMGGEIIPRYEWELYKMLVNDFRKADLRLPAFGDYAISHPKVLELDIRLVKPTATIRYTIDDCWYIVKGKNVRDHKFNQYRGLSKQILDSGYFSSATFSWGDKYIQECASGKGKTGNLTTWRQVGTNHHIVKVTQDIANFYASSNSL